jgi:N-methylhydantoinase A/oxoprolinase/acetone carboxylase beta subunit
VLRPEGASVGGHQTMVEAVLMHTHGIGGDSEVRLADRASGAELLVGPRRVLPLALVATTHPDVLFPMLLRQSMAERSGEFDGVVVIPARRCHEAPNLTPAEVELRDRVGAEPIAADRVLGSRVSVRALSRLVSRGLVRLGAFTPTDATHVLGLQEDLDREAAQQGALLFARRRDRHGQAIAGTAEQISQTVVETLVRRSSEAVLEAALQHDGLPAEAVTSHLVSTALDGHTETAHIDIGISVPIVGLGAPASTYYPRVAALVGSSSSIPENADVANAIGAVVGRVRMTRAVTITSPRRGIYRVHIGTEPETFTDLNSARSHALDCAQASAAADARAAGGGDIQIQSDWTESAAVVDGRPYFVEGTLTVTASGRPDLR